MRPCLELSKLLREPLSIRSVVPSPAGDAVYLNCRQRDDLVYFDTARSFRIKWDAHAALAEYLRRERQKKSAMKADAPAAPEDVAYLGEIVRLPLPALATVQAVSPDGQQLLISHQNRDLKMYTRRDLWLVVAEVLARAPDAAAAVAGMRNISGAFDRILQVGDVRKGGGRGLKAGDQDPAFWGTEHRVLRCSRVA